ncbi:MAG: CoA transferase, partial [Chloroflexota bacterium]|nr:CoA transferase [Chloroflexota bacterium]
MNQILSSLRIVELGTDVATANVGRLLAAYGADVITVEPPGGHPVRHMPPWPNTDKSSDPDNSILFAYLGTGKRSVVLDFENPSDVAKLSGLVLSSDGVIDGYKPGKLASFGLDLLALSEIQPSLSIVQVTPFGQTGPYSQWAASALTAYASGGQMYLTGDANKPPLLTAGHQAHMQASLHAFGALLTAIYAATKTGVGDI